MAHLDFAKPTSPEAKRVLEHIQKMRGEAFSEIWLTMLHHPALTKGASDMGQKLRFEGCLPGSIREAVILYIASACKASYEWAAHIERAKKEGIPKEVLALLEAGRPFSAFKEPYREALEAAQMALEKRSLPPLLQDTLIEQYGEKGLVELVLLAGYYQMLAVFLNAFEVKVLPLS